MLFPLIRSSGRKNRNTTKSRTVTTAVHIAVHMVKTSQSEFGAAVSAEYAGKYYTLPGADCQQKMRHFLLFPKKEKGAGTHVPTPSGLYPGKVICSADSAVCPENSGCSDCSAADCSENSGSGYSEHSAADGSENSGCSGSA